jgi:hypothetical protein
MLFSVTGAVPPHAAGVAAPGADGDELDLFRGAVPVSGAAQAVLLGGFGSVLLRGFWRSGGLLGAGAARLGPGITGRCEGGG